MLKYPEEHREELKSVLKEYKKVFPTELHKIVLLNLRLGYETRISLQPGSVLAKQKNVLIVTHGVNCDEELITRVIQSANDLTFNKLIGITSFVCA